MTALTDKLLPAGLLLAIGIVAYGEIKAGNFPPRPYRFVGVALIYTILGVVALASLKVAGILALAIDIGLVVRPDLLGATSSSLTPSGSLTTNTPVMTGVSRLGA